MRNKTFTNFIYKEENIFLSLLISTIFCFLIIHGKESLQGIRFTSTHDGTMIYKTAFDLINTIKGGNSGWSIHDLANRTFISFGGITHNLFSLPIAIIYFVIRNIFPNIPENILYRNVFIYSFFPLVNIVLTLGYNLWLKALKINNFLVSIILIPLLIILFGNEIWGLLYTSPSISLLPYLLFGTTKIINSEFKKGFLTFFLVSLIGFVQIPVLFTAYILPIPWLILTIYGIINFFKEEKGDIKNWVIKLLGSAIILSISFAIIKLAFTPSILNKAIIYLNSNGLEIKSLSNYSSYISLANIDSNIQTISNLSKASFCLAVLIIFFISIIGVLKNKSYKIFNFKANNLFILKNNIFKIKKSYIYLTIIILCLIMAIEIGFIVNDLRTNYYADTGRLKGIFNLTDLPRRNFAIIYPSKFLNYITNSNNNKLFNGGGIGYIGIVPISLFLLGIKEHIFSKRKNLEFTSITFLITLLILLAISNPIIALLPFFITSLLYPFSFLQNNLTMLNYQLDYLLIPFIVIGFNKFIRYIGNIDINFSQKNNYKFLEFIPSFIFIVLSLIFTFFELLKSRNYIKLGKTYEKLEIDNGLVNNKKRNFLIDIQNPSLISSPSYIYKGNLPTVSYKKYSLEKVKSFSKDNNWRNNKIKFLKSFGTKFTHISDYYNTLFASKYETDLYIYETRHASIKKSKIEDWPDEFISIKKKNKLYKFDEVFKSYDYKNLPKSIDDCSELNNYSCFYINKLFINISKDNFIEKGINLRKNMIGLKLPNYLNHLSSNIFLNDKEIELYLIKENQTTKLIPSQGFLEEKFSYDIGNIKSNYLVIKKELLENNDKKISLNFRLIIKAPKSTSIIRKISPSSYTYFINSSKDDLITIANPFSKEASIYQNNKIINIKKSKYPIEGIIELKSNYSGISKIDISYKNHKFSNYSYLYINIILTFLTIFIIFSILTDFNFL